MTASRIADGGLRGWVATAALALLVLLGGCSSELSAPAGPEAGAGSFNDADVKFAQTMIPHHEQAVEMAEAVAAKSGVSPEVTQLAQQIENTQGPQLVTLTGFLTAWDQPLLPDHGSEAHEDHWAAEGVLTPEEMQELAAADGPTGQELFLEGMIRHHAGAVAMVQEEIDGGENPAAVELARTIKTGQTAEIETMRDLLAGR